MGSLNAIAALFGPLTGSVSLEVAAVCLLDRWRDAVVVLLAHVDTAEALAARELDACEQGNRQQAAPSLPLSEQRAP